MERIAPQVRWSDLWAVVRTSAVQRLGKPLLLAYLGLALFGGSVVAASVLAMWIGPR
jgi:hypothetical protein